MYLEINLHIIPNKGNYILYNTKKAKACIVNDDAIYLLKKIGSSKIDPCYIKKFPDLFAELKKHGVILDAPPSINSNSTKSNTIENETHHPSLILSTTHGCNLKCKYCYASAGSTNKTMKFSIAKAGIDYFVKKLIREQSNKLKLMFHGGGEPFYGSSFFIVKKSVDYAKSICNSNNIGLQINAVSNGVLSKEKLSFIKNNNLQILLSLDGYEKIQNENRPFKNGSASFDHVMKTIEYFESNKVNYNIRTTVTEKSVYKLDEIYDFFISISSNAKFHFEPLFECGRCHTTNSHQPSPLIFAEEFLKLKSKSKKIGRSIKSSLGEIRSNNYFCGALSGNFCLTPEGNVTSCTEVTSNRHKSSEIFFYGIYDKLSKEGFTFFPNAIRNLHKRNIYNLPHCRKCIAKFSCAGDCPVKMSDIFGTKNNSNRCLMQKNILTENIKTLVNDPHSR